MTGIVSFVDITASGPIPPLITNPDIFNIPFAFSTNGNNPIFLDMSGNNKLALVFSNTLSTNPDNLTDVFIDSTVAYSSTSVTGSASPQVVPAPLIGHGLLVLLAVGGILFGARLWERSKKRSVGNAIPHPAA
jgi:hypothetical protein